MADPVSDFIDFFKKRKAAFLAAFVALLALLAALGTGFQNATAVAELIINGSALTTASAWGLGIAVGGIASTVVNFCLNIELLESFWDRLTGRNPSLPSGIDKKIQWGLGIGVFIVTGILFGLTAVSVGATGGLAIAAIAAGVFVTLVMIPQELETWLQSFDNPVTVTVDKTIYDIKNLEAEIKVSGLLETLKLDIKKALLVEKLKELKEELAQELGKEQEKKQQEAGQVTIKVLKNIILHLEKHEIDLTALELECANISNEFLRSKLFARFLKLKKNLAEKYKFIDNAVLQMMHQNKHDLEQDRLSAKTKIIEIDEQLLEIEQEIAKAPQKKKSPLLQNRQEPLGDTESLKEQNKKILEKLLELKKAHVDPNAEQKTSIPNAIKKWWRDLTPGRFVGLIISLGNVMALSLLFTVGLTTFLTGVGVAALPALIIGFSVAFTFGAFTEFYFYHYFLADFCDHIVYRWKELINAPNWGAGILLVAVNGSVNGILAYFGVLLLGGLLAAAGIAAPPLLPLAIVASIFAGVASLLLGSNFWIKSAQRFFTFGKQQSVLNKESELNEFTSEKKSLLSNELSREETKQQKEVYQWMFAPAQEYSERFNNSLLAAQNLSYVV